LSNAGKIVVSVWNRGCTHGYEAQKPWTAYRSGDDITQDIIELDMPLHQQSGVRIGILHL